MRAFIMGVGTAIVVAVLSAVVLQGYVATPVGSAFATSSVRAPAH
ncbi:hypothetical protein [Arenibaculum pallidiluteum]|nr:hypothetical protein [Arenibaculum pallidiluteum]